MTLKISGVVAAMVVVFTGCAPSYCDRTSPCPNDVMATPAQRTDCKNNLNANSGAKCYAEILASANCQADNIVCDANGKTDGPNSSTKANNNCNMQNTSALACCLNNKDSSACH